jgi:RHS repeat-associated protein
MSKQGRTIAVFLSLAMNAAAATHGADLKFRAVAGPEPVIGHYVVTLADSVAADLLEASAEALAEAYLGQLEPYRSAHARQFAIAMLPPRARALSADPRVREVVEIAQADDAEAPPPPSAVLSSSSGLARQHLVPAVRDTYSVGTYTYDGAGNIIAIGADTYVYDTAQRLVSSVTRGVEEDYTYDASGNRKSASGAVNCLRQATCAQPVTVDSNTNHLTTINNGNVTYDAAGNIATISGSPGAVYSYDGTGMMTEATVGSDDRQFIYTADGERIAVRQGVSWTWTVRDLNGKVLREFTSLETGPNLAMTNRQWVKDYVWRDGLLLATVTPSGTLHYHLDHLGTPRLVTDANGVKVAEHAYYPFGAELNLTPHETPEEAMKFTGHERDIVAGDGHTLDYMHARYDNSSLGRFLSVDPVLDLERTLPNPQGWNRYSYVRNNPIGNTDPNGKICIPCAAVGALAAVSYESYRQVTSGEPVNNGRLLAAVGIGAVAGATLGAAVEAAPVVYNAALANPAAVATGTSVVASALTPGPGGEMPSIASPISGEIMHEVATAKGSIGILANATTKGTTLTLADAAVYPMAAGKLSLGTKEVLGALKQFGGQLKDQGYTQLIIQGVRATGANPGKKVELILDLTKL